MGLLISADVARLLSVTLDGRELGRWWVAEEVDDVDVLDELGTALVGDRALPPAQPVSEPAEDPPRAAQSVEEPGVVVVTEPSVPVNPGKADTATPPVAVSGTREPQRRGEAERGKATDAQVRTWATSHGIPCSTTGGLKVWVREAYERVGGDVPDFEARRRARSAGADPTTPSVRPEVAGASTIATWCLRNGIEDRGGNVTVAGRQAYAAAWRAAHPDEKPPAASVSPTGEDPPASGERAGRAAPSGAGVVNGHRVRDFPSDSSSDDGTHYASDGCDPPHPEPAAAPAEPAPASVRPVVEPIGDGTGQPASSAEQLARADELAADGRTPRQICSEAGVWLSEARAAVRKATER